MWKWRRLAKWEALEKLVRGKLASLNWSAFDDSNSFKRKLSGQGHTKAVQKKPAGSAGFQKKGGRN
jgi:hypothetical protein